MYIYIYIGPIGVKLTIGMSVLYSQGSLSPETSETGPMVDTPNDQDEDAAIVDETIVEVANEGASQNNEENDDENPFSCKKRKRTSKVWVDFKVVKLLDIKKS